MFAHKIPMLAMILQSGPFARVILLILIIFSIISWTIIIAKWFQFLKFKRSLTGFFKQIPENTDIAGWLEQNDPRGKNPAERLAQAAGSEQRIMLESTAKITGAEQASLILNTRYSILQSIMEQAVAREVEEADWGLTFLAVCAGVAPFLGLLGTVWGITHSFYDIGSAGSTSINIVAPGIAEALVTTIFGLVVAIPSAFFYNLYARRIRKLESQWIDFSTSLIAGIKSSILGKVAEQNEHGV